MTTQVPSLASRDDVESRFTPAWWLPGPHLQTVGARWTRPRTGVALQRERLTTPDDDFLDLDWATAGTVGSRPPDALVVVLHGLEGSARSGYALQTYRQLATRGIASVGLNFRSCSGELNRGQRLYHSGETDDLRLVVRRLRERFPAARLGAVGFSLGGNVLVKYLGEEGQGGRQRHGIVAAAAISVPYDLAAGAAYMEQGLTRLYGWRLLRSLQRKVRVRAAELGHVVDVRRAVRARTFRAFDAAATAPLHGFRDADDYYARSSSARWVERVRVPTLLVHAEDDPFLPPTAVPRDAAAMNPHIHTCFTAHGGHVGFVAGAPWKRCHWAERRVAAFLADRLAAAEPASSNGSAD